MVFISGAKGVVSGHAASRNAPSVFVEVSQKQRGPGMRQKKRARFGAPAETVVSTLHGQQDLEVKTAVFHLDGVHRAKTAGRFLPFLQKREYGAFMGNGDVEAI